MRKGCCIIETRSIPNLFDIIKEKHLKFIPLDWGCKIFLSTQNKSLIENRLSEFNHEIEIEVLPDLNLTAHKYNSLLTNIDFWEELTFDKVLIFQSDSEILREGIEHFLDYDFVGAPLYHIEFPLMNGGLSLRTRQKMIDAIKHSPYDHSMNEDMFFCKYLQANNGILPSKNTAQSFSVETIYSLGSIGIHAIDKWHDKVKCGIIRRQYK